jgi:hypothetical protein
MNRLLRWLVLSVMLTGLLVGCGDSGKVPPPNTVPVPKEGPAKTSVTPPAPEPP